MAEIINLRRARKAKAKADKDATAQANRVKHGLTKADRTAADAKSDLIARRLDGHRLVKPETGGDE